jgi:hypothetical protein
MVYHLLHLTDDKTQLHKVLADATELVADGGTEIQTESLGS